MCGIAGFFTSPKSASNEALTATVRRMTDAIVTRGPDDEGA
jgi:asparagine synthase (glutamine-hydrolysing)